MSNRYQGAWLQNGAFNPLAAPTPIYTYGLYSWGRNNNGQLGLNNRTDYSSPKQVGSLTNWNEIATLSANSGLAVKTDGTLWSWGNNNLGQLGLGNTTSYSSPRQVGSLTNWLKVSGGSYSSYAIKTDGTLWSWGNNSSGELGLGNTNGYSSPKQIGALTNWSDVAGGQVYCAYAIKTDGTLWSWGFSGSGQLGLNNATNYSSPKQIGALTNWLRISAGQYFAAAIKTDGTLWMWGVNGAGQLGVGNTVNRSSPTQVGVLTNWSFVRCGAAHTMAIKTDGTLWAWGNNSGTGCLGNGNTTSYSSPIQIGALTNWSTLSCGNAFTISVKTDFTLWSWGQGGQGRLGLGNITYYSSPKQVGSLTNWGKLAAGSSFSLALAF